MGTIPKHAISDINNKVGEDGCKRLFLYVIKFLYVCYQQFKIDYNNRLV